MTQAVPEVLAVVPARAGSKGVPGKNLLVLDGQSLVHRACAVGRATRSVACVVVTSDDEEIGAQGLQGGADLFVRRPTALATDTATGADAWHHAWTTAEEELGRSFPIAVLLQPTSPTRTTEDVRATVQLLVDTGASAALTVSPVPQHYAPAKMLRRDAVTGRVSSYLGVGAPNRPRQGLEQLYWLNGHCYAVRRATFLATREVVPPDAQAVVLDRQLVNIDEPGDVELARRLLEGAT